ncbi:MFS transporter [Bradyrhizobium sp. CCBAU 11386]|uniref:MFS transporter n=1 Tax=Bradyrhizobium sp. CCBAU 11386 TaxID=1630837 RepID=UPI002FDFA854
MIIASALIYGSHAVHDAFAVIRWSDADISTSAISFLWSEAVVAEVLVFMLVGPTLLDRFGVRGAAILAAAAGIVRWSVAGVTTSVLLLSLIQPLHGLTFALLHLACMRMMGTLVAASVAATAQALYAFGSGLLTAVLTLLSGALYASYAGGGVLSHGGALRHRAPFSLVWLRQWERLILGRANGARAAGLHSAENASGQHLLSRAVGNFGSRTRSCASLVAPVSVVMRALQGVPIDVSSSWISAMSIFRRCPSEDRCGSTKGPTSPEHETSRCEPSGHLERVVLAAFQRDLLGKHNISDRQIATRHETQAAHRAPLFVDLADVRRRARVDPILPASIAAGDLEVTLFRERCTLGRR